MDAQPATRTFVPHGFPELSADLGEVAMNYVVAGEAARPALLLIPGQTESWWGYEAAVGILAAPPTPCTPPSPSASPRSSATGRASCRRERPYRGGEPSNASITLSSSGMGDARCGACSRV